LLDRREGRYWLSPLGLRLQELDVNDPGFLSAIRAALESPALFRSLLSRFRDAGRVPEALGTELEERGIKEGAWAEAERVFRRSAIFARVLDTDGSFRDQELSGASDDQGRASPQQGSEEEWEEISLMLTDKKRAWLRVPRSMTSEDYSRLKKW